MTVDFIHIETAALFTREHVEKIIWHDDGRFEMFFEPNGGIYTSTSMVSSLFKVVRVY